MLDELKNKRILILGFGQEGQDTYKFLKKLFPNKVLGIGDRNEKVGRDGQFSNLSKKDKYIKWHLGKDYLKVIKDYDVVIKSPGIPFKILPKTAHKKITSQTKIFFENCQGTIIGVAGTKGKGTTSSLIYQILKQGGFKTHLIGNIGKPALSFLLENKKDNIFVYELSSFQLMDLEKSPQIAVLLNNYPDHLDWHKNFQEYVEANANITKYQNKNDILIYSAQDKITKKIANKSKAKKIPIPFYSKFKEISNELIGKLHIENINAAIIVGQFFKVSKKNIILAIKNFKSLPHRLEMVGTYQGITFYDDSISTIPETAINALNFLGNKVQTIILGGSDKGSDYKNLAKRILKSNIKNIILFPTTGEQIWQEINKISGDSLSANFVKKSMKTSFSSSRCASLAYMKEAVRLAYLKTNKGKICLLSPASASFGLFENYSQRGNLYKLYVKKYSNSNFCEKPKK